MLPLHKLPSRSGMCLSSRQSSLLRASALLETPERLRPLVATHSQKTAVAYLEELAACEANRDCLRAVEVLAEMKMLHMELPPEAVDASVRIFSQGGQWQRALEAFERLQGTGCVASSATISCVFQALEHGKQLDKADQLVQDMLEQRNPNLSLAYNSFVRMLARLGCLERAFELLQTALTKELTPIQPQTFNILATEMMKAGQHDQAEEVLELRDYF